DGIADLKEAAAIAIRMAVFTPLRVVHLARRIKIIKDLAVRATRLACGHVLGHTCTTPPILLCVVCKDAFASIHAARITVLLRTDVRECRIDPLFLEKPLPDRYGLFVFRDVV